MSDSAKPPKYPLTDDQRAQLESRFNYHAPKDDQPERYQALRGRAMSLAALYMTSCPPSRELSLALTKLEESVMWANASIARGE